MQRLKFTERTYGSTIDDASALEQPPVNIQREQSPPPVGREYSIPILPIDEEAIKDSQS